MKYRDDLEGKVINIGDQYFTIHFQEDLDRRFERLGQCDLLKGLIWLDAEAPERPILSTLIHEVVEAIVCNCALEIKHDKIVILENTLFSFCMNNPDVLEILIREAHEKTGSKGNVLVDMDETNLPPIEEVMKHLEVKDVSKNSDVACGAPVDGDCCGVSGNTDCSICDDCGQGSNDGKHSCEGDHCDRDSSVHSELAYDGLPGSPNEDF